MFLVMKKRMALLLLAGLLLFVGACSFLWYRQVISTSSSEEGVKVPVIMYHSVLNKTSKMGKYIITPQQLDADFEYITEKGYETVVMDDLINYVYNDGTLPEKPIMITFDDGYYNNYSYAYPLLKKYGMKAVLSVIGQWADYYTENENTNNNYAHINWDLLKEMSDSGVFEIQNHSYNLHSLKSRRGCKQMSGEPEESYRNVLQNDIMKMQEKIKDGIGKTPTTFTYPFGAVSPSTHKIIKEFGFKGTLSSAEGVSKISHNPQCLYMIKRYNRPYGTSSRNFFQKMLD